MCWHHFSAAALLVLAALAPARAAAQGYPGYPNTIMTPERGAVIHRHAKSLRRVVHSPEAVPQVRHGGPSIHVARGSSGSVLPTPLPRTPLIPPENRAIVAAPPPPREQGPTFVPGLPPIPNLPHGSETFQDRAARCTFQQGLYNVPAGASTQYMAGCLQ